jgi:peptide/nickel transport system ATP-binding protein
MREMRKSVQMIFQDPFASLNPRMTVGAAIAEPFLEHKMGDAKQAKDVVADMLKKVGLTPDMAKRYPHEFSGGQRQRVCIARALALEPKVIVADESVSALDVSIKAQVINLMLDLQQSLDLAFLFISHDMAVVERVSHRVAVMYLGEIVEIGPRAAVFGNPQHAYTKRLMSAVPVPDPGQKCCRHRGTKKPDPSGRLQSTARTFPRSIQWPSCRPSLTNGGVTVLCLYG